MAEKTVAQKLLIKPDTALWVSGDDGFARLGPLPEGARRVSALAESAVAVLFVADEADLRSAVAGDGPALARVPVLWVVYPKGGRSDINRDTLWPIVAELGLRPITQVAIDETWSALRFRPLKPDEVQFRGR